MRTGFGEGTTRRQVLPSGLNTHPRVAERRSASSRRYTGPVNWDADEKAGVHWHLQGQFVGATAARGKVRIGAHGSTCDTWGLQWTATRVR